MTVKTALGMIIRTIDTGEEILRFIENAEKYGHKLDCVIIGYTRHFDRQAADSINKRVPLFAIDIKNPVFCRDQFRRRGISDKSAQALLECPVDTSQGLVPYGYKRTVVLTEAILRGMDVLFFADNDVFPTVLKKTSEGHVKEDVDFFGAHLEYLNSGSQITTGEYSGYNILPPASFDGMEDLLHGLQKADMLEYWNTSNTHRCLAFAPQELRPKPCTKILGGNTAMKLAAFSSLPPFYSSYYTIDDELFLCRGEDTVLGLGIEKSGITCTDIELNPLHDTYMNYPEEPDLRYDPETQRRFYYACTGWVGRNPFLNYLRGADIKAVREFQREKLEHGLLALAGYTSNPIYISVLRNFNVSWDNLDRYVSGYEQTLDAWEEFNRRSEMV